MIHLSAYEIVFEACETTTSTYTFSIFSSCVWSHHVRSIRRNGVYGMHSFFAPSLASLSASSLPMLFVWSLTFVFMMLWEEALMVVFIL